MARIISYFAKFICTKNENHTQREFVSSDKKPKVKCNICKAKMEQEIIETEESFNVGGKNKQRSKKDSTERRLKHFKKEIFETLPKRDRSYFAKKHNWKH